jgi:hypothetical protein
VASDAEASTVPGIDLVIDRSCSADRGGSLKALINALWEAHASLPKKKSRRPYRRQSNCGEEQDGGHLELRVAGPR